MHFSSVQLFDSALARRILLHLGPGHQDCIKRMSYSKVSQHPDFPISVRFKYRFTCGSPGHTYSDAASLLHSFAMSLKGCSAVLELLVSLQCICTHCTVDSWGLHSQSACTSCVLCTLSYSHYIASPMCWHRPYACPLSNVLLSSAWPILMNTSLTIVEVQAQGPCKKTSAGTLSSVQAEYQPVERAVRYQGWSKAVQLSQSLLT